MKRLRRLWSGCGRDGCCEWMRQRRKLICGHVDQWKGGGKRSVGLRAQGRGTSDGEELACAGVTSGWLESEVQAVR